MEDDKAKEVLNSLLEMMNIDDEAMSRVSILEAVGELVLMIHWLRGIFYYLSHVGVIKFTNKAHLDNFKRLLDNIELYESFVWESAPPRALLLALREFRIKGTIHPSFKAASVKDSHGRIPYGTDKKTVDDIKDVLRRAAEVERYRVEE